MSFVYLVQQRTSEDDGHFATVRAFFDYEEAWLYEMSILGDGDTRVVFLEVH